MTLPDRLSRRHLLASIALPVLSGQAQAAERLVFGIVPYLPTRRLVGLFAPLVPILEKSLNREVDIVSATDYRQHLNMLRAKQFDIVADSLFISRIAQRELGHVPVARTLAGLETVIVAPKSSSVQQPHDLIGKTVCVTDRIASLSIIGLRYLRDQGLAPGKKFNLLISGTHSNSIHLMLAGDAGAAIVSRTTLTQIDPKLAAAVKIIAEPPKALSAVVYHVHPKLSSFAAGLQRDLLQFANEAPQGKSFSSALGHLGLAPVTAAELKGLDPMVVEFYRQLAA